MRNSNRTAVLVVVSVAFIALVLVMLNGCRTNAGDGAPSGAPGGRATGDDGGRV